MRSCGRDHGFVTGGDINGRRSDLSDSGNRNSGGGVKSAAPAVGQRGTGNDDHYSRTYSGADDDNYTDKHSL